MGKIDVKTIIIDRLKEMGADGLCDPHEPCGCGIDDLFPCDNINAGCLPAKKHTCNVEKCDMLEHCYAPENGTDCYKGIEESE